MWHGRQQHTWTPLVAKKICSPYCSQKTRASAMHQAPTDTDSVPSNEKNIPVWWCIMYVTAQPKAAGQMHAAASEPCRPMKTPFQPHSNIHRQQERMHHTYGSHMQVSHCDAELLAKEPPADTARARLATSVTTGIATLPSAHTPSARWRGARPLAACWLSRLLLGGGRMGRQGALPRTCGRPVQVDIRDAMPACISGNPAQCRVPRHRPRATQRSLQTAPATEIRHSDRDEMPPEHRQTACFANWPGSILRPAEAAALKVTLPIRQVLSKIARAHACGRTDAVQDQSRAALAPLLW